MNARSSKSSTSRRKTSFDLIYYKRKNNQLILNMQRERGSYHGDGYGLGAIEDLLHDPNEWRKVQDVVLHTIKGVFEVLKNQGESIRELEKSNSTKVTKQELLSAINQKANLSDMNRQINDISMNLDNRISVGEFQQMIKDYVPKMEINQLRNEIRTQKRTLEDLVMEKMKKLDQTNDKAVDQINRLREAIDMDGVERKAEIEENSRITKNMFSQQRKEFMIELDHWRNQLDSLRREFNESISKKYDSRSFTEFQIQLNNIFEQKVDIIELQNALNTSQNDLAQKLSEIRDEVKNMIQSHDLEFFQLLNKKANIKDVTEQVSIKADVKYVQSLVSEKLESKYSSQQSRSIDLIQEQLLQKCTVKELDDFSHKVAQLLQNLSEDLAKKANMTEVIQFLDLKSNHQEVARAFADIQREMIRKVNIEELRQFQSDQSIVNESLCTENIVGRWTYKHGPLQSGSTVPWNMQVVNTLPENYIWEKDKPTILVVAPGLYEITLGFYAKKKPKVDVLVNGEPIIGAVNSGSYVVHHSSGKLKDVKNSVGIVTGLTMIDFIILPARARLSLTYQGELGEGFLGLKRL